MLSHVQMSKSNKQPFAILKAANGASLNAIGGRMLTISTVTVITYIFRDTELVHNLLGIAPNFSLYHHGKILFLVGERDAQICGFVHAALRSPPPTTFLRAVERGFINGLRQFPRLTTKMVKHNMPNSEAMARGHLRKTPTTQPHALSDAVSAH
jgi:hypothetical protein